MQHNDVSAANRVLPGLAFRCRLDCALTALKRYHAVRIVCCATRGLNFVPPAWSIVCVLALLLHGTAATCLFGQGWQLHIIDNGSRGADGVRLGDANRDGRPDIVTGWEEGGQIRVCFNPGIEHVRMPWPVANVGTVGSPEDAVFADVNRDGWLDVVSCCEGRQQAVFFHLSPGNSHVTNGKAWSTQKVESADGVTRWMFCEPLEESGGIRSRRLMLGSKNPHGRISLLHSKNSIPHSLLDLRTAGWIMSLKQVDIDRDGDADLLYSDRKGKQRGVGWLERVSPTANENERWVDHRIAANDAEFMFLNVVDRPDAPVAIVCQTFREGILLLSPGDDVQSVWRRTQIPPDPRTGTGKGIAVGDIDLDGTQDIVASCGNSDGRIGVYWLSAAMPRSETKVGELPSGVQWLLNDISGVQRGVKFDRIELLDVDHDGDLDVITCEERDNLGVIWYENPVNN
jgi:FG-GAP-like repeat